MILMMKVIDHKGMSRRLYIRREGKITVRTMGCECSRMHILYVNLLIEIRFRFTRTQNVK